ncbi:unnamed protein product [Dovyalis caffra]|uniref:Uncharacterized protein n=1 Tax=Dovyalis caffra TaxID=77055 RepID=A0AAV1SSG5_9ROSI|nr:unnamed protein product [Dovyalis caffra]
MGEQAGARSLKVEDSEDWPDYHRRSGVEIETRECGTKGEPEKGIKRCRVDSRVRTARHSLKNNSKGGAASSIQSVSLSIQPPTQTSYNYYSTITKFLHLFHMYTTQAQTCRKEYATSSKRAVNNKSLA